MSRPIIFATLLSAFLLTAATYYWSVSDKKEQADFKLQLLHFSDIDGHSDEVLENVKLFSALVKKFRTLLPDETLLVSSGDNYIVGELYFASNHENMRSVLGVPGVGRGQIALLNHLGVRASALGNHELDKGTEAFVESISPDGQKNGQEFPGAQFPFLGINTDFTADKSTAPLTAPSRQNAHHLAGRLTGSAFVIVGGEKIGIVGVQGPDFPNITDTGQLDINPKGFNPQSEESMERLALLIQKEVDALVDNGINKIILLSHMQELSLEKELAQRLREVDIIVAGGSGAILADSNDILKEGDVPQWPYPIVYKKDAPTLLVNTSGDFRYLGRLIVSFDTSGRVILDSLNVNDNGIYLAATAQHLDPMEKVVDVVQAFQSSLGENQKILGQTNVALEGRREKVRTEETNLGNLVSDAYLSSARKVEPRIDAALVAAGGIRSGISIGPITFKDIKNVLPFNGKLSIVTINALELVTVLEHMLSRSHSGKKLVGRFPQVSGLQLSFNAKEKGLGWIDTKNCHHDENPAFGTISRLKDLVIKTHRKNIDVVVKDGKLQGERNRTFMLVTSDYHAQGGDLLPYPCVTNISLRTLSLTEQLALSDYVFQYFSGRQHFNDRETPMIQDRRIQNLKFVKNFSY